VAATPTPYGALKLQTTLALGFNGVVAATPTPYGALKRETMPGIVGVRMWRQRQRPTGH